MPSVDRQLPQRSPLRRCERKCTRARRRSNLGDARRRTSAPRSAGRIRPACSAGNRWACHWSSGRSGKRERHERDGVASSDRGEGFGPIGEHRAAVVGRVRRQLELHVIILHRSCMEALRRAVISWCVAPGPDETRRPDGDQPAGAAGTVEDVTAVEAGGTVDG